jgi:hypothetical protein
MALAIPWRCSSGTTAMSTTVPFAHDRDLTMTPIKVVQAQPESSSDLSKVT